MMDNIRREDRGRKGLLTEREKKYIGGKIPFNSKIKSKLYNKLDRRLDAFVKDFEIILRSKELTSWRYRNMNKTTNNYAVLLGIYKQFGIITEKIYFDMVMYRGKKEKRVYWLQQVDIIGKSGYNVIKYFEQAIKPDFSLRGLRKHIRETDNKSLFNKLRKAVEMGLLPFEESKALTEREISKLLN